MSGQRYERVSGTDRDESPSDRENHQSTQNSPASPPPSFRSRASSPTSRHLLSHDPLNSDADQALADSFDTPSDEDHSEDDDEEVADDRQRSLHRTPGSSSQSANEGVNRFSHGRDKPASIQRRVTAFPVTAATLASTNSRVYGGGSGDGVFANLDAKPERGEKGEEQPPSYEQAAADATPPYWETTILAPGVGPDEVFIDGLAVGSVFSFIWNGMISMSFQLVGFLLTYLLHTTHAAKNGSKAGLGITLIQYGFYMKGSGTDGPTNDGSGDPQYSQPADPNSHDFDSSTVMANDQAAATGSSSSTITSIANSDWIAYALMIVGWFILIRSVSNFLRARRHEQLVLQSPDRGLNVPIVATGERAETVV
ncbi:MAG: hypothetical protein M1817_004236 [Caeruleum heppii]|nr:MAG: hypothetical protein M1817_004236 [Caeruleum heppii]